jgi:kynurenine formamidase
MIGRFLFCWLLAATLVSCSQYEQPASTVPPIPKEIIDLGALITEDTPEIFWGKGLLNEMGFEDSNSFDVITWDFGPVAGSNSYFRLFNHGGPHVDAPNHVGLGLGVDSFSIDSLVGPLKVFDFSHLEAGRTITTEMVSNLGIAAGDVVIFYTGYSVLSKSDSEWWPFVAPTYMAAQYLADIPVRAFGTDGGVESVADQSPVDTENPIARTIPGHYAFLSRGIPVYEHLVNVDSLLNKSNMYFVGVPLNIKDGDGMMVRPVVLVY